MQLRKSGEAFITHPVEVTRILAELKMDHESLIAGLLHDTVEDTENVKFEEIEVCAPLICERNNSVGHHPQAAILLYNPIQ